MRATSAKLSTGARVPERALVNILGVPITLAGSGGLSHIQFRCSADCAVCGMHLRTFVARRHDIAAARLREVVVFRSPAEEVGRYAGDLPFDLIADADGRLYRSFGVESPMGGTSPGLPADFLVAGDGRVIASWYGAHVHDQWSIDQLLTLAGYFPAARHLLANGAHA
jgi:peroxiredoxin